MDILGDKMGCEC